MKHLKTYIAGAAMALVAIGLFIACQLYIETIEYYQPQPDGTMAPRIKAGETATFVIHGGARDHVNRDDPQILIFSMLAPKNWNLRENAEVTYVLRILSDGETVLKMMPVSPNESPVQQSGYTWNEALTDRFGFGNNILNDMEWVTFQGADQFMLGNGDNPTFDITVKVKVPEENQRVSLGFFINDVQDGMTGDSQYWDYKFTEPFTIYDGKGNLVDYCSYHFYSVEPTKVLQDDIVTFSFVSNAYENNLAGGDVYLRLIAHTDEGNTYTYRQLMDYPEPNSANYTLTLWPGGVFDLAEDETILNIEYAYTNADESEVIDLGVDLKMTGESYTEGEPFNLTLSCN